MNNLIGWLGKLCPIRCDNGPEYVSKLLQEWAAKNCINLLFIQPGNPQQNAYVERYNRTVRYDWLNQYLFSNISICYQMALVPRKTKYGYRRHNAKAKVSYGRVVSTFKSY